MSTSSRARRISRSTSAVDQRIRDAIDRLLARQASNGSFGLWGVGGDDAWLDAYVTDFLTRARERGFAVPDTAFKLALDRLRNVVGTAPEPAKDGGRNLAYALYVLARNGAAPLGDLRYLADTKLADLATPIAKAQIAAALGLLGDRARAERVYTAALDDLKPPTRARAVQPHRLRLDAARCRGAGDARERSRRLAADHHQRGPARRGGAGASRPTPRRRRTPGWCWPRARWRRTPAASRSTSTARRARARSIAACEASELAQPLKVTNTGEGTLQAVVSVTGAPITPEPAAEKGFKIERLYYTLDGEAGRSVARPSRTSASWWC